MLSELGSLSAFQICRMITSGSEFAALIPPTSGLTHVALTAARVLVREQGARLVREEGASEGGGEQRRGTRQRRSPHTPPPSRPSRGTGAKLEPVQPLKPPTRPGVLRKQHPSQVMFLPYFLLSCYAAKILFR